MDLNGNNEIKRVFKNLFSLFFLRGSLHLLHFITYPFLIRMLGVERFGLVVFGQAVIMFFSIITDFGFNLSAVKEISVERENKKKVDEIFNSVFIIKIFIAIFTFIVLLFLINFADKFKSEKLFFLFMYGYLIGYVLFPIWFFQGLEDMKYITYFNLAGRIVYTVFLFVFVRKPEHYILVPVFLSVSMILCGVSSFVLALKKYKIKIYLPSSGIIVERWKKSFHYFLSNLFISIYNYSNVIFLGLFLGNSAAGLFSMGEKIYQAVSSLYYPLNDALYPYMAKFKNFKFYDRIFKSAVFLNILLLSGVMVFSNWIILVVYGNSYIQSSNVLRILSFGGMLWLPALLLGYPLLGISGKASLVNNSIIFASILHIGLLFMTLPFTDIYVVAGITVFTQFLILAVRFRAVKLIKPGLG